MSHKQIIEEKRSHAQASYSYSRKGRIVVVSNFGKQASWGVRRAQCAPQDDGYDRGVVVPVMVTMLSKLPVRCGVFCADSQVSENSRGVPCGVVERYSSTLDAECERCISGAARPPV